MADTIRPQEGPQSQFSASSADIAIFGGAAGGGKTFGLLIEPLRHIHIPAFGAVFFRRSTVQVRNEGGLWDESLLLYPGIGGTPREQPLQWRFPAGTSVTFAHLEYDKTVHNWQGSQIPLICLDELCHFTEKQFWYIFSRNRSVCGVRPYLRATCNPDADSWVKEFIQWWLDVDTGLAIPERAGVIRWFVRTGETIVWADLPHELSGYTMLNDDGKEVPIPPKSATFICSKLTDNKILMQKDPGYMASLLALPTVERERLLHGNWNIRPAAGLFFNRSWCEIVDEVPSQGIIWVRGWDLAATEKSETNDPDWTTGTLVGRDGSGTFYVADHVYQQKSPNGVERLIKNTASQDGRNVRISIPKDPGQAGKAQALGFIKMLVGYKATTSPESGDKETRFSAFSAQAEGGNVIIKRGAWNARWFSQLEGFPEAAHDDDVDSTSRAFNELVHGSNYALSAMG